jgi:hypothetical protein
VFVEPCFQCTRRLSCGVLPSCAVQVHAVPEAKNENMYLRDAYKSLVGTCMRET